jgi:SsrA-binding protein
VAHNAINIRNPKARHNYHISETFEAGLVLLGTQVKAIRDNKVVMLDAYVDIVNDEVWVKQLWIGQPKNQTNFTHDENQWIKLLLHYPERVRLYKEITRQGCTVVPLRIYQNERGFIKMEIGVGEGKTHAGKREALKEREAKRQMDRVRKGVRE